MTWTEIEILAAIQTYMPQEWEVYMDEDRGVWNIQLRDEDEVVFETTYLDKRIALFNVWGFVWRRLYKVSNPIWERRRGDLRVPARHGVMNVPGGTDVPDPDDLNPSSVYDLDPTRRPK